MSNPIAALLNIAVRPGKQTVSILGTAYELYAASGYECETLYRAHPGHGVSNPGFSLINTPAHHHAMQLGQYLAGRPGVKRAEAEALVASIATRDSNTNAYAVTP